MTELSVQVAQGMETFVQTKVAEWSAKSISAMVNTPGSPYVGQSHVQSSPPPAPPRQAPSPRALDFGNPTPRPEMANTGFQLQRPHNVSGYTPTAYNNNLDAYSNPNTYTQREDHPYYTVHASSTTTQLHRGYTPPLQGEV